MHIKQLASDTMYCCLTCSSCCGKFFCQAGIHLFAPLVPLQVCEEPAGRGDHIQCKAGAPIRLDHATALPDSLLFVHSR